MVAVVGAIAVAAPGAAVTLSTAVLLAAFDSVTGAVGAVGVTSEACVLGVAIGAVWAATGELGSSINGFFEAQPLSVAASNRQNDATKWKARLE